MESKLLQRESLYIFWVNLNLRPMPVMAQRLYLLLSVIQFSLLELVNLLAHPPYYCNFSSLY